MSIKVMPHTKVGQWGFWLSVAFIVIFLVKVFLSFPLPSPAIFAVGIAGLVLNVIAIFKKERGLLFFVIGGIVGAFVVFFVGGELLFPH